MLSVWCCFLRDLICRLRLRPRRPLDRLRPITAVNNQTLEVDYPDEMTSGDLQLVRQQLLDPKDAPAKPTVEQGEVAVRVPQEALPQVEETATPYGLSPEQEKEGRYHREQLQIVPEMQTKWNPGKSKGRAFIDKLRGTSRFGQTNPLLSSARLLRKSSQQLPTQRKHV